jgi:hypothetical protein
VRAGRQEAAREHLLTASVLFRDMGLASLLERAERQLGEPFE